MTVDIGCDRLFGIGLECATAANELVTTNDAPFSGTTDDLFDGNATCGTDTWNTCSTPPIGLVSISALFVSRQLQEIIPSPPKLQ